MINPFPGGGGGQGLDLGGLIGSILQGIAGIGSVGVGIANAVETKKVNQQNFGLQEEAFDWMQSAQQTTWDREDNAVQRRIADLKAAGLNPMLAAGSAAQSSSPVHLNAPQQIPTNYSGLQMGLAQMGNIAQTMASVAATNAQIKKTNAETDLLAYTKFSAEREKQITMAQDLLEGTAFAGREGEAMRRKLLQLNELTLSNITNQQRKADADVTQRNLDIARERGITVGSQVNNIADLYKYGSEGKGGQESIFLDLIMKALGNIRF